MASAFSYIEIVPHDTEKETNENTNMTGNVYDNYVFPSVLICYAPTMFHVQIY